MMDSLIPLGQVAAIGGAVAVGPLLWWRQRSRSSTPAGRLRALTALTLFLTFDLIIFGAFTRLTDSGLGCPDWPGCYSSASPLGARDHIETAQTAMPTGPVTHGKAWIEMTHRYLASGVGLLILVMAGFSWRLKRQAGEASPSPWWPTLSLVWVCVVGAFGRLTVTMKLFPAIVTLHLLLALGLLMLLAWLLRSRASDWSRWLLAAAGWQLLSGLSNVVLDWPIVAALAHTAGAAVLLGLLTTLLARVNSAHS